MDLHTDPSDDLHEHLEHIPWSDLTTRREFPRWIPYAIAAAITVAALGVFLTRTLGRVPVTTPIVPVTVAATAEVVTTLPEAAPLYSEADLMALVPGTQEQLATARAVWFLREYFGTGGAPGQVEGVMDALPDGATIVAGTGGASYVEWAEPFGIEQVGDGLYRVEVVLGMLSGGDSSTLRRLEPRAVAVVVAVAAGEAGVVDLPIPIGPPAKAASTVWPDGARDIPETVVDAAKQRASVWGSDPEVVAAGEDDHGWRVEVLVSDEAGVRWPMAVWIDGAEVTTSPPWEASP